MTKSLTYIMSGKLINTYYQDYNDEYLTTINPKEDCSWYKKDEDYTVAIKSNTMLHAFYCFENHTIYYFDNQARLRMKTETNNYDLVYTELKKEWVGLTESFIKKVNKAFKEGYYD